MTLSDNGRAVEAAPLALKATIDGCGFESRIDFLLFGVPDGGYEAMRYFDGLSLWVKAVVVCGEVVVNGR